MFELFYAFAWSIASFCLSTYVYFYIFASLKVFYIFNHIELHNLQFLTFIMIQEFFCKNRDVKACEIIVFILLHILEERVSINNIIL